MKLSNEQENWLKFRINKQKEQKEKDLRDYFAAMAMQGLLASGSALKSAEIVRDSYYFADMMLKERKK